MCVLFISVCYCKTLLQYCTLWTTSSELGNLEVWTWIPNLRLQCGNETITWHQTSASIVRELIPYLYPNKYVYTSRGIKPLAHGVDIAIDGVPPSILPSFVQQNHTSCTAWAHEGVNSVLVWRSYRCFYSKFTIYDLKQQRCKT